MNMWSESQDALAPFNLLSLLLWNNDCNFLIRAWGGGGSSLLLIHLNSAHIPHFRAGNLQYPTSGNQFLSSLVFITLCGNNRHLFLTVLVTVKSKIKILIDLVPQ